MCFIFKLRLIVQFANIVIILGISKKCYYLCGCEWLYGTYFGRFRGFVVGYKADAMEQAVPIGLPIRINFGEV